MKYKVGDRVLYLYRGRGTDIGTIITVYPRIDFYSNVPERYTVYWDWCKEKSAAGGFTAKSLIPYNEPNDIMKDLCSK